MHAGLLLLALRWALAGPEAAVPEAVVPGAAVPGAAVPGASACPDEPAGLPAAELSRAEILEDVSPAQVAWFKPRLRLLPQNPRAETDFTAYTLEPGEVKLGLVLVQVGLLPNVQAGTSVPLDLLRIPNGNLKIDAVRQGPLDVSLEGSRYQVVQDRYSGSFSALGSTVSVIVLPRWSLHLGGSYVLLHSKGVVDLDRLSPLLTGTVDGALDSVAHQGADAEVFADAARVKLATELRLNRRDSVVLQGGSTVWARVETGGVLSEVPPIMGLDQLLAFDGYVPFGQYYDASASWQLRWRRAELRLGLGLSTVPLAWLTEAVEFSYRIGGATRLRERRQANTWRRNRREVWRRDQLQEEERKSGGG